MKIQHNRRDFLKLAGQASIAVPVLASISGFAGNKEAKTSKPGKLLSGKSLLVLNVRDYGAIGDGVTNDTVALQQTINRCEVLGGGEVSVPAGNYLTGSIQLRSNVILRLENDAILTGTADFNDYPVMQVRWEGKWIPGHTGLIYAVDAENTGIKGPGKIAGNYDLGGRPTKESPLRHPALIEPFNCQNLLFEDFSTDYHLMWSLHPTYCENIVIRNLTIRSTGGNGDGIDIDSCKHVLIEGCDIATGDDCISLKSGRGMEGYTLLKTTEDVQIRNCKLSDSIFACIGIGSETSGGIRDVVINHCSFTDTKSHAIYIKSRPGRGAFIENITASNLDVSGIKGGFLRINQLGSGIQDPDPVPGDDGIPAFKNFRFSNIKVNDVAVLVDGASIHPSKPLDGFEFVNVTGNCGKGISLTNTQNATFRNINVSGFIGPLLSIQKVSGKGLQDAVLVDFPTKVPEVVANPEKPFRLQ
jgi:polygalacturonase